MVFVIGHHNGNNNVAAQRFTTGRHPYGYELYNFQVNIQRSSNGADPLITIRDATTSLGGEVLYTLENPLVTGTGWQRFAAPVGATLDPDTSYVVRIENKVHESGDDRFTVRLTTSTAEDSEGLSDWSVRDLAHVCLFGAAAASSSL